MEKRGVKYDDFETLYQLYDTTTKCNLCNIQFDNTGRNKKCLDHCHLSNAPRFMCCDSCNKKLGKIDRKRMKVLLELHRYFLNNF